METQAESPTRDDVGAALAASAGACAVKLDIFEGPLDLLLHLCRANEVDIGDIPIALICEQYLAFLELMRELDIDVAAEYLVMAATLAHIKSRTLLPPDPDAVEEDEEDPLAELSRRLAAFAAFREAADELGSRPMLGRDVFSGSPDLSGVPVREPVLQGTLFQLIDAMRRVLAELPPEDRLHEVARESVTVQERMLATMDALQARDGQAVLFEDLLRDGPPSRVRVVMTFLAVLELAKIQALRIYQDYDERGVPRGPVRVRLAILREDESGSAESGSAGGEALQAAAPPERPGPTDEVPADADPDDGGESTEEEPADG